MAQKINAEDGALILALAADGLYASVIARKFELSARDVAEYCTARGQNVLTKVSSVAGLDKQILVMLKSKVPYSAIMEQLNTGIRRVRKVRDEHLIPVVDSSEHRVEGSKAKMDKARKMIAQGLPVYKACHAVKLSTGTWYAHNRTDIKAKKEDSFALYCKAEKLISSGLKVRAACKKVGISQPTYNRRKLEIAP